jgi:hypothetical protein
MHIKARTPTCHMHIKACTPTCHMHIKALHQHATCTLRHVHQHATCTLRHVQRNVARAVHLELMDIRSNSREICYACCNAIHTCWCCGPGSRPGNGRHAVAPCCLCMCLLLASVSGTRPGGAIGLVVAQGGACHNRTRRPHAQSHKVKLVLSRNCGGQRRVHMWQGAAVCAVETSCNELMQDELHHSVLRIIGSAWHRVGGRSSRGVISHASRAADAAAGGGEAHKVGVRRGYVRSGQLGTLRVRERAVGAHVHLDPVGRGQGTTPSVGRQQQCKGGHMRGIRRGTHTSSSGCVF